MIDLKAKKSLGQNFLVDSSYHERIAGARPITEEDTVVEIGPGTGLLTRALLNTPLKKLIAFELDDRAVPQLKIEFRGEGDRFEVLQADILNVDLQALAQKEDTSLRIFGNIPYYITSPIIFKLVEDHEHLKNATLLVQLEVAERLAAKPRTKEYGIPTVLVNFFAEVTFLFKVPRGAFRPVPNVDSAVVFIDFTKDYFTRTGVSAPVGFEYKEFQKMVRTLFQMRRKTIRNNMKNFKPEAIERLEQTEQGKKFLTQRAEELSIAEFLDLYEHVR